MVSFHFKLRLAEFRWSGKSLANRLFTDLAGQTEIWAMARLIGLMTPAVWFPAPAADGGDRTAAKIA